MFQIKTFVIEIYLDTNPLRKDYIICMADLLGVSILAGDELCQPIDLKLLSNPKIFFKISEKITQKTDSEFSHFNRSLPRDGFLSLCSLYQATLNIDLSQFKNGRIGLYTAFMNGPMLGQLFDKIKEMNLTEGMAYAKKWWPPKQHFRQNAPLRATHFAIHYKLNGPQMCFVHPQNGLHQAIEAAKIDLRLRTVDLAIVTASFSFEDIQTVHYYSESCTELREASVSLVFNNPEHNFKITPTHELTSGVCTPYLKLKTN